MSTNKFKVGAKIKCVVPSAAVGVVVGRIYTVVGYNQHCLTYGCVLLEEVDSSPFTSSFVLVSEDAVLTPEEVFEHLRKGTQLQWLFKGTNNWINHSGALDNIKLHELLDYDWRIKPEPEIITLNGKRYQALED